MAGDGPEMRREKNGWCFFFGERASSLSDGDARGCPEVRSTEYSRTRYLGTQCELKSSVAGKCLGWVCGGREE
jgi:hypothetical protein